MATIKELINSLVDKGGITFRIGTVTDIDTTNDVCTVQMVNGDADMLNVQLKAIVDGQSTGFIIYPKLNTMVVVGLIDGVVTHSFIAICAEVDNVKVIIGNNSFIMDANTVIAKWEKWQFNDGSNDGLVNIKPLVDKINQLENKLNDFINYSGALPIPVEGSVSGPAIPANVQAFLINPITQQSDLEDTKITH